MEYLVAVRDVSGNEIFTFSTIEDRKEFTDELDIKNIQYATTEVKG
jgi:hypothetical protein